MKIDLTDAFGFLDEPFSPRIVAELNEHYVKVVKLDGEFVWHHHDDEDELFLVMRGRLRMQFRDREDAVLVPGQLLVVPHGVDHCPLAEEETHVVLIEPKTTVNTGSAGGERTREDAWL